MAHGVCTQIPGSGQDRISSLDGLRGVAVFTVVVHHATSAGFPASAAGRLVQGIFEAGWLGVDLFFALSGFLITRILLETRSRPDYYSRFYWRRTVRIFPLYFAALGLVFVFVPGLWVLRFATYTANLIGHEWEAGPFVLSHFWSLCVEEHFYMAWPLLVRGLSRRDLVRLIALTVAGCALLRAGLFVAGHSPGVILRFSPCRVDSLASGAAVALLSSSFPFRMLAVILWPAVAVLVCLCDEGSILWLSLGRLLVSLLAASVVGWVLQSDPVWLRCDWLQELGRLSYGLYVWHFLFAGQLFQVSRASYADLGFWGGSFVSIVAWLGFGLVAAILSERLLERPFLSLR